MKQTLLLLAFTFLGYRDMKAQFIFTDFFPYKVLQKNRVESISWMEDSMQHTYFVEKNGLISNEKIEKPNSNDPYEVYHYEYDSANRVISQSIKLNCCDTSNLILWSYDKNGNLDSIWFKDGPSVKKAQLFINGKLVSDKTYDDPHSITEEWYKDKSDKIKLGETTLSTESVFRKGILKKEKIKGKFYYFTYKYQRTNLISGIYKSNKIFSKKPLRLYTYTFYPKP